jgi:hypothetical protein
MKPSTIRFWRGAGWGVIATALMTLVMFLLSSFGFNVLPEPAPLGILARIVARAGRLPSVFGTAQAIAFPIHLAYGAFWAGLLAASTPQVTVGKGLLLGLGLWVIMLIFFIPMGGQYTFAMVTQPGFWVATLAVHLVYGGAVGLLVDRPHRRETTATFPR